MHYQKTDKNEKPYLVPEVFRDQESQADGYDYYIHAMDRLQRLESKGLIPAELLERTRNELYCYLCKPSLNEELQSQLKESEATCEELRKEVKSLDEQLDRYQQSRRDGIPSDAGPAPSWPRTTLWILILVIVLGCLKACHDYPRDRGRAQCVPEIERNLAGSLMRLNIHQRRSQPCS